MRQICIVRREVIHVDPTSGDDRCPGTEFAPLRTFAEAERRWRNHELTAPDWFAAEERKRR